MNSHQLQTTATTRPHKAAGKTDFARLFRLKGAAGVRHYYVENDQAPAPYLPDITTSFRTLRALRV